MTAIFCGFLRFNNQILTRHIKVEALPRLVIAVVVLHPTSHQPLIPPGFHPDGALELVLHDTVRATHLIWLEIINIAENFKTEIFLRLSSSDFKKSLIQNSGPNPHWKFQHSSSIRKCLQIGGKTEMWGERKKDILDLILAIFKVP